jgi:excisionase family DNA binding protein
LSSQSLNLQTASGGAKTLVVATVTGGVVAFMVVDAVHAWRHSARVGKVHVSGLALGVGAWFVGGLFSLMLFYVLLHSCGGTEGISAIPGARAAGYLRELTDLVLTVDEAAERLRVSRWSVYNLIRSNQLRTVKIGRRRLVPVAALDEFLARSMEVAA